MDLKIYLVKNKITCRAFAKQLGITPTQLSRIISGKCKGRKTAQKIEELTNGVVTRYNIKPELRWIEKRKRYQREILKEKAKQQNEEISNNPQKEVKNERKKNLRRGRSNIIVLYDGNDSDPVKSSG